MNKTITKKEFSALKHLSDGKQHNEAPERLTSAQYYVALNSLKIKDMVRACFEEGGGVVAAQITMLGQVVFDDLKEQEAKRLRRILKQLNITQNQYKALCQIKENGKMENIIVDSWGNLSFSLKGYYINNGKRYVLTDQGKDLLQEIDDLLDDDCNYMSNIDTNQAEQELKENGAEKPKETKASDIHVANGHLSDVIKIIQAMCDLNYFVDANGNKVTNKSVMETLGEALNAPQFKNYSPNLNRATQAKSENTYLEPFYALEDKAKEYYKNHNQKKN